ncbi:hypothetical protein [Planococcus sp. YIM B11945]|uniref:hypothetical protein n=1 Tax=Planococcus sp. YIM B11945 TaxID=3435410 RepID=UPI003D7D5979
MISLIVLPMNFFDRSLNIEELELELNYYMLVQLNENGYVAIENLDRKIAEELNDLREDEKFYVPTVIVFKYRDREISKTDLFVYVYLCLLAFSIDDSKVKPLKKEISRKLGKRKTEVEESLNNLITVGKVFQDRKNSGYYIIDELANPMKVYELEAYLRREKKQNNLLGIVK